MKKYILITITSICFLLSTSVLAISKARTGDNRQGTAKKHRVAAEKQKSSQSVKKQNQRQGHRTALKRGHKHSRFARNSRAPEARPVPIGETDGEFTEYQVQKGDTVEMVAAKFGVQKEDLFDSNGNLSRKLSPGTLLLIPKMESGETEEEVVDLPVRTPTPWKTKEERYMLVKVAKSFMGAPYRYGGESVRGLDCSAYVKKVYGIFDVDLPRIARDQYLSCPKVSREELSVGDLVFFKTKRYAKYPTHVGIYIGEGNFIHSSSTQGRIGVKVDSLRSDFYSRTYVGATRVKKTSDENPSDNPTRQSTAPSSERTSS